MLHRWLPVCVACFLLLPVVTAQAGERPAACGLQPTQLPPPFGGDPDLNLPGRRQCTPEYRKQLKVQIQGFERLRSLARNEGEQICTLLESSDDLGKLGDGKLIERLLPGDVRDVFKALGVDFAKTDMRAVLKMLGVDLDALDLRKIRAQCRQTQGDADRMFTSEIGRLGRELIACDDTI